MNMPRGTQHKRDWKETTLQVVIDAKRLYCHSVKIMSNEKVFKPSNDFRGLTLIRVHELLLDVYTKTWEANRINVSKEPALKDERLALQRFHPDKTVVVTADNAGIFLGFKYRVTESGKVLMFRDPVCVKANRRTYRRLANKIKRREALASDLETSYTCVRNFMAKGNSKRLLRRMDHFVNSLMEEINGTDNQRKSAA